MFLILILFGLHPVQAPLPPQAPAVASCICGDACPLGGCEVCACPAKKPALADPKLYVGGLRPMGEGWRYDATGGYWWRYASTDAASAPSFLAPGGPVGASSSCAGGNCSAAPAGRGGIFRRR